MSKKGRSQRPVWLGEDRREWDHIRIHHQLLDDHRLGAYEIMVYIGIARHAEVSSGYAHPAVATLAEYGGMGPTKARAALQVLKSCGYVDIVECPGVSSTYVLLPPPPPPLPLRHEYPPGRRGPLRDDATLVREARGGCVPGGDEQEPGNQNQNENLFGEADASPEEESKDQFDRFFWPSYPKRNGRKVGKGAALRKWQTLTLDERRRAFKAVKNYARAVEQGVLPRDAERFLRDSWWEEWVEEIPDNVTRLVPRDPDGTPHSTERISL